MNELRRQKRIASLIKDHIAGYMLLTLPDSAGMVTVTRVEMSKDLKTASVYISVFGDGNKEDIIELLRSQTGSFRKAIASGTKLKYNPLLIFEIDPFSSLRDRIDELISQTKKDEKRFTR